MVLHLSPLKNFTVTFSYPQGRKQQGAPPDMAMDFFWGEPARTVKYHGFAPAPPQKFHRGIFYHQGRKQEGAPPGMATELFLGGDPAEGVSWCVIPCLG